MPPFKNLTGQRFGRLLVLERTENNKKNVMWKCQCDCGKITVVSSRCLFTGSTKSCGCLKIDTGRKNGGPLTLDLRNKRFGRLIALSPTEERRGNKVIWKCQCDCGKIAYIKSVDLQKGTTRSCGCLRHELLVKRNTKHGLTGTKEYNNAQTKKRRDRKQIQDTKWTVEKERALRELQPHCVICGTDKTLAVDHVRPLSLGYGLDAGNVVTICKKCNSSKKDKCISELPLEWQASIIWNAFKFKDYWQQKEVCS